MSIREKTIFGFFWALASQFSVQIINVLVQIILARLLAPSQFGLIAMLSIFMAIGGALMDAGFTLSLIRTKEVDDTDYSTVFFINLGASIILYAALFVSAPAIALLFRQPILASVVRVYGIGIIIQAFAVVQVTRLTKEMNFKAQMIMQIPSVAIGGAVGIVLAYKGFGVWSLVWMTLVQAFLFALQHWFWTGWRPKAGFDWDRLKKHFSFGYKLTASFLLDVTYDNIYNLVIGRFYSVAQLGYYNRAQSFQALPINNISSVLQKVTFAAFSSINDDNERLKRAFKTLMIQVVFWIAPTMILLIIVAKPLFVVVLTAKWLPAVPYFRILCIAGIVYPLHQYNLNILTVKGKSDLFFRLEVIKKVIMTIGIISVLHLGIYGLLYFQVAYSYTAFFINTIYSGKMIDYPAWEQLQDLWPILTTALVAGGITVVLDNVVIGAGTIPDWVRLGVVGGFYMFIYFGISLAIKAPPLLDFKELFFKKQLKLAP